ncbi:MAG: ribonuclease P protein component [Clostridia bacterium]|nr:ribonuclease P protein component [Clostridia bacterium]
MRIESVKENVNFKRAYHQGKSAVFKEAVIYWRKNRLGVTRLGITVRKKLGNSPQRNRIRRIIREGVRAEASLLPRGCDIVIVARSKALSSKSTDMARIVREAFSA